MQTLHPKRSHPWHWTAKSSPDIDWPQKKHSSKWTASLSSGVPMSRLTLLLVWSHSWNSHIHKATGLSLRNCHDKREGFKPKAELELLKCRRLEFWDGMSCENASTATAKGHLAFLIQSNSENNHHTNNSPQPESAYKETSRHSRVHSPTIMFCSTARQRTDNITQVFKQL